MTFAVLFGVAQLFCACISAQAAPVSHADTHASSVTQSQFGLAHSILGELTPTSDQSEGKNESHSGHHDGDHADDCSHCEGYVALSPSSDTVTNFTIPSPSPEKTTLPILIQRPKARANMSPSALAGLRWLHPPTETPVTLKIRLLN